jgi:hypothetical protein
VNPKEVSLFSQGFKVPAFGGDIPAKAFLILTFIITEPEASLNNLIFFPNLSEGLDGFV